MGSREGHAESRGCSTRRRVRVQPGWRTRRPDKSVLLESQGEGEGEGEDEDACGCGCGGGISRDRVTAGRHGSLRVVAGRRGPATTSNRAPRSRSRSQLAQLRRLTSEHRRLTSLHPAPRPRS